MIVVGEMMVLVVVYLHCGLDSLPARAAHFLFWQHNLEQERREGKMLLSVLACGSGVLVHGLSGI